MRFRPSQRTRFWQAAELGFRGHSSQTGPGATPGSPSSLQSNFLLLQNGVDFLLLVDTTSRLILTTGAPLLLPETVALIAQFTTPPTAARAQLINNLIAGLIAAGVWPLLDILYVWAAADSQAARLNWISPGTFTCTAVNSPMFTADRGFQGDGSTSYLDTNWINSVNGIFATLNSAHLAMWSLTSAQSDIVDAGSSGTLLEVRTSADLYNVRINSGANNTAANTNGSGYFISNRSTTSTQQAYRNGVSLGSPGTTSNAVPTVSSHFLGRASSNTFSIRQQSIGHIGGSLTAAKAAAASAAFTTYMQGVGAA